jgi:hypothetical protein
MSRHGPPRIRPAEVAYAEYSLSKERRKIAETRESMQPVVKEAFWKVDGRIVTIASAGVEVEAQVVLKAIGEYNGSIRVRIRRDVALRPEKDCCVVNVPVNLVEGKEKEVKLSFVPDKLSGNSLRGYFIEIDFSATKTKWVMENSYPPRLRVT